MKHPILKKQDGQALAEMLISIPLLFLFAAGIIQFAVLFLADIQFEHACGEACRLYCANILSGDSLEGEIWTDLGSWNRYFDRDSLNVSARPPRSTADSTLAMVRSAVHFIPFLGVYEGNEWKIQIRCHPPLFFAFLFPHGVVLKTAMQAYRYPGAH